MRTTVSLDDDVLEAAKALMSASGQTLGQVLSQLVRRSLRGQEGFENQGGLPTFKVGTNAAVIPSDRASKLLAEE